ncbi:biotin--[acetyl-CoA-carboxylase] ligase [Cypionkella aquatica]|uniref:biotin--[biotin carboxyl-carrier protein] ligase n=2 Tax=Cypionkella aquatica TaxID=1756042 RepID=A0AA37TWR6_9RHOB|nr:biotin--[acetyl-CoA-carboxylase] ligase [Cypionkella aquatica]
MALDTPGPAWFLGLEQTAGRGRRARPWASPRGNFYASLLLHPTEPPEQIALRSFAASLALRDAFVSLTGLPGAFALKWPNDVLLNGGKVAGILLESTASKTGFDLAIGIGVNLIGAPDPAAVEAGATVPVSLLAETGLRVTPEAFLDALAPAYAAWEALFIAQGFAALRQEWLAHAARLGDTIRARTGTQTREGVFETIDPAGNLILRMSSGPVAIPAAEVFF